MSKKRIFIFLLIMLMFCLWGQETASIPRKMAIFVINKNIDSKDILLYANTLVIQLEEDPDIMVIEPLVYAELDTESKLEKTKELGGDCYIEIQMESSDNLLKVSYNSFDIYLNKIISETKQYQQESSITNLKSILFYDIISMVNENYQAITGELTVREIKKFTLDETSSVKEQGIKVVFQGLPGTRIVGLEDEITIDENGMAIGYVPRFTTQKIWAYQKGYYPAEKLFYIEDSPNVINIIQIPASIMALDIFLQEFDYIGANFAYYFIPDFVFAQAGFTLFGKKLIFPIEDDESSHKEAPIIRFMLAGGYYLNTEESLVRFSLKHGLSLNLLISEDLGIIPNPLAGFGVNILAANVEISPWQKLRVFFEYNISAYFTDDANLVQQALFAENQNDGNNSQAGYIFITPFIFDLLDVKLGFRFQL